MSSHEKQPTDRSLTQDDLKNEQVFVADETIPGKDFSVKEEQSHEFSLFRPLEDAEGPEPENEIVVTFRSVLVGCILGSLVNASNLYLGLKSGLGIGANMFSAMIGFVVVKSFSKLLPKIPLIRGYFGPKENSIIQTAATTSGGLAFIYISGIPALYKLGLMESPQHDYWRLVTFSFICAYYGLMFAIPMRKFFLITVAEQMKLVFPSATAVSIMIKNLHNTGESGTSVNKKVKCMLYAFISAAVFRIVSAYAPGILWDWHIFTWFYIWGKYSNGALAVESWRWYIEWTPAFTGIGTLVGPNVALSFLGGSILAWGIIGPAIVSQNLARGIQPYVGTKWAPYTIYASITPGTATTLPTAGYWLLWPGIMILICSSMGELLVHGKLILDVSKAAFRAAKDNAREKKSIKQRLAGLFGQDLNDAGEVRWWMWLPGTIILVILSCVIMALQYHMDVGTSLVALLFGFLLSFLVIQCVGVSDNTPITAVTKMTQLVLSGVTANQHHSMAAAQRINIAGAQIAGGAAYAANEMIVDFRVAYLLRVPVLQTLVTQLIGNVVAVFLSPALFILFTKAYPCILDASATSCAFAAPAAASFTGLAQVMTAQRFPVPTGSGICALVLGVFSFALPFLKRLLLSGEREKYRAFVPSMTLVGLAFVTPAPCYSIATAIGALGALLWRKRWPASAEAYLIPVAAGMIGGEGIGGVFNAILEIAKVSGTYYGTDIACPVDSC